VCLVWAITWWRKSNTGWAVGTVTNGNGVHSEEEFEEAGGKIPNLRTETVYKVKLERASLAAKQSPIIYLRHIENDVL
jgi:hypothetical protein